jgi:CheY-like chemotaxis protein
LIPVSVSRLKTRLDCSRNFSRCITMSVIERRGSAWGWQLRNDSPNSWGAQSKSIAQQAEEAVSLLHYPAWSSGAKLSPTPQDSQPSPSPNSRRVLVIEDDATTCSALKSILTRRGWDVLVAPDLARGIVLMDQNPQCVILDLMLPDGDGIAILKYIRARNLPTKVVVTTGVNDTERLEAVRGLNPTSLLRKPIDLWSLLRGLEDGQ